MKKSFSFILVTVAVFLVIGCRKDVQPSPSIGECKVALLHMSPEYGQKEKNISIIYSLAEKAFRNGADIVVAPEMATDHYYFDIENVSDNIFIRDESKEFSALIELAGRYGGYICLGYPEKNPSRTLYNSAVVLGKDGVVAKHRKRTLPGWNSSGNLELPVFNSRFGKIGVLICADTNVPVLSRVSALKGCDIILVPCTWNGDNGQLDIWSTRARENGVWVCVCNRYGRERKGGMEYDLSDSPSAVISPYGDVKLSYMHKDHPDDGNIILYCDVKVDGGRNVHYLRNRSIWPSDFYGKEIDEAILPPAGTYVTAALTVGPSSDISKEISGQIQKSGAEIAVLPENIIKKDDFSSVRDVASECGLELLAFAIDGEKYFCLKGGEITSLEKDEYYIDLDSARVAFLTGTEYMSVENVDAMGRLGADMLVVSSSSVDDERSKYDFAVFGSSNVLNSVIAYNGIFLHLAYSSSTFSSVAVSREGINRDFVYSNTGSASILSVPMSYTRKKFLYKIPQSDLTILAGH